MKIRAKIWAVSGILAAAAPGLAFAADHGICTTTGPWNVQFQIDATNLGDDLVATTTDKDNVNNSEMPDIDAGSSGWNACFNAASEDGAASVTVVYSHNGENNFQIQYISESAANDFDQTIEYKWLSTFKYAIDYNAKTNVVTLLGTEP